MTGLSDRRRLTDDRLLRASARCPDDGRPMAPTGRAYSMDTAPVGPQSWLVAFRCPLHADETIPVGGPDLYPLLAEVLDGVDVAALPVVRANEL